MSMSNSEARKREAEAMTTGRGYADVDTLAAEIRRVDGNHDLGAGALAEALMPWLTQALTEHDARTGTESEVEALVDALFARKYQRAEVPESFDQSRKSELREVAAMVLAAGYRLAPSVPDGARETALRERIEALAGQWERLVRVKNSYSEIRHSHARDLRAALTAEAPR